jgi:hypothetical protein
LKSPKAPDGTYEAFFRRFSQPFYIDVRNPQGDFTVRTFMFGPQGFRDIGALYLEGSPSLYVGQLSLSNAFDLMFYVPVSTPTRIVPFTP